MPNRNAQKGRAAERCAQRYLEHLGWTVIDVHHNDALEGLTNADLLAFPDGDVPPTIADAVEQGVEVQVKYSSAQSYGSTSIYNRHEREGVDLGTYRTDPADADRGEACAILWGRYDGRLLSGGVLAYAALTDDLYEVGHVMGKTIRGFVRGADVVMVREPNRPWLFVWNDTGER